MVMPSDGYPHEDSDEELVAHIAHFTGLLTPTPNDMARIAPLVQIGQAELQMRTTRSLIGAIDAFKRSSEESSQMLNGAVAELKTSSGQAARELLVLTWFLIGLTAALFGATVALTFTSR